MNNFQQFWSISRRDFDHLRQMIKWRLKYYVQVTADAMRRNTQAAALILILLGPALLALLFAMAKPLMHLLNGSSWQDAVLIWIGFVSISLVWVILQRLALMGGLASQYLQCLPVSPGLRLMTDFCIIAYTNSILFIPYLIAVVYVFANSQMSELVLNISLIGLWVCLIVMLQLAMLNRIRYNWIGVILSFTSPILLSLSGSKVLTILVTLIGIVIFSKILKKNQKAKELQLRWVLPYMALNPKAQVIHHLIRIYIRQLFESGNSSRIFILLILTVLPVFLIPLVQAGMILENFLWVRWTGQELTLFVTSVLLAGSLYVVSSMQLALKTQYQTQCYFLQCNGIALQMIERAHHKALFIMGAIALLPSLLSVGYWLGWQSAMLLLLICPVLLMLNIWIQKSPEETHVVSKLLSFVVSVVVIRVMLGLNF